jgi:Fe-S-cluster containining protein
MWVDECARCGRCCSHLRSGEGDSGLTLFSDEVHLFPENMIRPHLAKGVSSPEEIFTYQHTMNVCIHLVDNLCRIYENRPLMCRSFPVKIGAYGLRFSPGCLAVLNALKKSKTMSSEQEEVKAAISMTERLYEFHKNFGENDQKWKYNLATERWKVMTL